MKTDPPSSAQKRIFIVEDHPAFREGLVQIVTAEPDLTVCGEADNATKAFGEIERLKPDLVLVDITLPGKSGLALIKEIRAVNQSVKLLVVSMHDEALYASRVLRAGGDGYIMKQEDSEEIVDAIHDVLSGHIYVSEEVMASLPSETSGQSSSDAGPLDQVSDTELEVLELLGQGKSSREIAAHMKTTTAAVSAHCKEIKKKLHFKTNNELVRYAVCWVETGRM